MLKLLYWSLYKNKTVETILYALLADLINEQMIGFQNGKIVIPADKKIPKACKRVIKHIELDKPVKIKNADLLSFVEYALSEFEKQEYFETYPIIGKLKTKKFKEELLALEQEDCFRVFSRYTRTGEKRELSKYFKDLDKITFKIQLKSAPPKNDTKLYDDMQRAIDLTRGRG